MYINEIFEGHCLDVLKGMQDKSVDSVVTSPPYWGLRDYGVNGQIGLEESVDEYINALVAVFREVRRVLKDEGTLWVNLGDTYAGSNGGRNSDGKANVGGNSIQSIGQATGIVARAKTVQGLKPKDLVGLPWRLAFALQQDGWYLRQDIIWNKTNPMPESVRDRPTRAHEYIFLLSKSPVYFYDHEAIKEAAIYGTQDVRGSVGAMGPQQSVRRSAARGSFSGKRGDDSFRAIKEKRNKRSVWTVAIKPIKDAHFATFPELLIQPCIIAGCPKGGVVLDPFFGSGTTGVVALKHERNYIGIELNPRYIDIAKRRLSDIQIELIHEA